MIKGELKLIDFGLACKVENGQNSVKRNFVGGTKGQVLQPQFLSKTEDDKSIKIVAKSQNLSTILEAFFVDLIYIVLKFAQRLRCKTWLLTDFMSPEVYSTYIIEDGEVNKEAMKENNLLDYEGQYSTSVQIKVLNVVVFKLFGAT